VTTAGGSNCSNCDMVMNMDNGHEQWGNSGRLSVVGIHSIDPTVPSDPSARFLPMLFLSTLLSTGRSQRGTGSDRCC
jgi:hypothetical protein